MKLGEAGLSEETTSGFVSKADVLWIATSSAGVKESSTAISAEVGVLRESITGEPKISAARRGLESAMAE